MNKSIFEKFIKPLENEFDHLSKLSKTYLTKTKFSQIFSQKKPKLPIIFISNFKNPFINLSIEKYLFENLDDQNILYLYKNHPSIIFGKNQNPWKEINFQYLKSKNLLKNFAILRRNSGGGTVIHDKGNINFCYLTNKKFFNKTIFSENVIIKSINEFFINDSYPNELKSISPIFLNQRGDLIILKNKEEFKISGSAYKISKGKSYHHGTMLLNCGLNNFKKILDKNDNISDNSIESNRVKIDNLQIDEALFYFLIIRKFIENFKVDNSLLNNNFLRIFNKENSLSIDTNGTEGVNLVILNEPNQLPKEVFETAKEMNSWEFKFAKTPKFQHYLKDLKLTLVVEKGKIKDIKLDDENSELEKIKEKILNGNIDYKAVELVKFFNDKKDIDYINENLL